MVFVLPAHFPQPLRDMVSLPKENLYELLEVYFYKRDVTQLTASKQWNKSEQTNA